jgi:hypothetical protein
MIAILKTCIDNIQGILDLDNCINYDTVFLVLLWRQKTSQNPQVIKSALSITGLCAAKES